MAHKVEIMDKEGVAGGVSGYSDICKIAAEQYANGKRSCYTTMAFLDEEQNGILTDMDHLHQAFLVMDEEKGVVGYYIRQRKDIGSVWGEWKRMDKQ